MNESTTKKRWLLPITILLLLIGGFTWWYVKGSSENFTEEASGEDKIVLEEAGNSIDSAFEKANQTMQETDKMPTTTAGMIDTNGNWVPNKSETKNIKLPNGTSIETYASSGEDKLNMFLSDPASKVSDELWFDCYDFNFAKEKATLMKGYENQLNNIKEILAAYNNVKIKIGGYAFSENDNAQNTKLSIARAKSVYQSLISHGVSKDFFDKLPYVALNEVNCKEENTNPEGRAKNCRIAICVTEK